VFGCFGERAKMRQHALDLLEIDAPRTAGLDEAKEDRKMR
jgi:hypothetical protein